MKSEDLIWETYLWSILIRMRSPKISCRGRRKTTGQLSTLSPIFGCNQFGEFPWPAWAVASCSSGPQAGGTVRLIASCRYISLFLWLTGGPKSGFALLAWLAVCCNSMRFCRCCWMLCCCCCSAWRRSQFKWQSTGFWNWKWRQIQTCWMACRSPELGGRGGRGVGGLGTRLGGGECCCWDCMCLAAAAASCDWNRPGFWLPRAISCTES